MNILNDSFSDVVSRHWLWGGNFFDFDSILQMGFYSIKLYFIIHSTFPSLPVSLTSLVGVLGWFTSSHPEPKAWLRYCIHSHVYCVNSFSTLLLRISFIGFLWMVSPMNDGDWNIDTGDCFIRRLEWWIHRNSFNHSADLRDWKRTRKTAILTRFAE